MVLLPRIGLVGAAIATTISYAGIVVFLAYQSLRVLPYKLELVSFARYAATGAAAAWLVSQLPVENPLLSAVVKGSLILVLYAGMLFAIDHRCANRLPVSGPSMAGWFHSSNITGFRANSAVTERT